MRFIPCWALCFFLVFPACISYRVVDGTKKAITLSNLTAKQNTRLSGHIKISGILTVPKGFTLLIDPGTRMEFVFSDMDNDGIGDAGMKIEGAIKVGGTFQKPVLFFGSRTGPKSWSEILIEHSPESSFAFSEFRDANWGLHIHFSSVTITDCRFIGGYGAMRFRSGPITVQRSLFRENNIGIRYIASDPVIRNNTFQKNITAIFIREESTNPVITANNFINNSGIALKLGESQAHDISAGNNFWNTTNISEIEKIIYDRLDADYLGRVQYQPIARIIGKSKNYRNKALHGH